mmetsp:Transcript_26454/g.26702  ORF Transcript_26454/g.26702 Transcript_26454/m.26702 type:complete len:261 (-) Transcript_26454:64-846(-)
MPIIVYVIALIFSASVNGFRLNHRASYRFAGSLSASTIDDKVEVKEYFDNEGFSRWNKIYSESDDVNSVQKDIRTGHQQTIDKVLALLSTDSYKTKTVVDCGCGVGSLALPMSSMFKKVFASDISSSMTNEASARAKAAKIRNIEFSVADLETVKGQYDVLTCIDVFIHYPTGKMTEIVGKLGTLTKEKMIISFAPKNIFYDLLKKVGELFPGKSKTTRAYLHPEADVIKAVKAAGFTIKRKEMTSTNFYFSRLLECERV